MLEHQKDMKGTGSEGGEGNKGAVKETKGWRKRPVTPKR